ncbi:MAG TPA: OmpA family protein [Sphingobacteriaceae bacterium]
MKLAHFTFYVLLIAVLHFPAETIAQDKDSPEMKKAVAAYNALHYLPAIKYLEKALAKDPENITTIEMIASAYRNVRNYSASERWYRELSKQKNLKPIWALNFAEALANLGNYEESEMWYRKYFELQPSDKRGFSFASADMESFSSNSKLWKAEPININTGASEYSPIFYKGGLVFVSNRNPGKLRKNVFGWDQTPFSDLYRVDSLQSIETLSPEIYTADTLKRKKNQYLFNDDDTDPSSNDSRTVGHLSKEFLGMIAETGDMAYPLKGAVNSKFHEGPAVALPDGNLMFTRNNYFNGRNGKSSKGIHKLKLFTTVNRDWNSLVPYPFNSDEYSAGHPAINRDGTVLIFASDMPGGFGGSDLYYSVRIPNGKWGRPVNLGNKINTAGNELFPYFTPEEKLLFSSTGHPGLGGLDIFEVILKELKPLNVPKNLGAPFNSPADDFGIIMASDSRSGYFSSNRNGDDDIFSFKRQMNKVMLSGTVVDARNNLPLSDSRVFLHANGETDTLSVSRKGEFYKELELNTEYEISGQRSGYTANRIFLNTQIDLKKDSVLKAVLKMSPAGSAQQWVLKNCDSLKAAYYIPEIYYDLDKYAIRADARPVLEQLVQLMQKHPEISIITSSHTDSRASREYNRRLSLQRGRSVRNYLTARGISSHRIQVEYFGKSRLLNRCTEGVPCSEEDQQLNRRTEFDIVLNGVNISRISCN